MPNLIQIDGSNILSRDMDSKAIIVSNDEIKKYKSMRAIMQRQESQISELNVQVKEIKEMIATIAKGLK